MGRIPERFDFTPFSIAIIYLLFGGAWILLSDQFFDILIQSNQLYVWVQTTKGWLFVGGSAVLIYFLMTHRERELTKTHEQRERALQQATILHRVVRHNLRNVCNVIQGNIELLEQEEVSNTERTELIKEQTEALIGMSETSRHLREIALTKSPSKEPRNLVRLIKEQIKEAQAEYQSATFNTELPHEATAHVVSRFDLVIDELIENAIEHHDRSDPTVWITVSQDPDGTITIDVADNGPGLPEMEEELLEEGIEKPLFHSQGLGLWLVRIIVTESGGTIRAVENQPRGTIVRVVLDSSEQPTNGTDTSIRETIQNSFSFSDNIAG